VILERLRLINFRCYSGTVDVVFSTDVVRNTTVIQGTNGAGKTSILQALNFALYGPKEVTTDSPLINNAVLKSGREQSPARAAVILNFRDDGRAYKLSRSIRGFLIGDRVHYVGGQDDVSLTFTKPDGNTERDPFPQQSIEKMLPSPIRTFFLFDGDRIADFTKPGRQRDDAISNAVNDVLHIEALSRAADHVGRISSEKRRALDRLGAPAVEKANSEINVQEAAVANRRQRLTENDRMLLDSEDRMSAIEQELSSILAVAKLAQNRRDLEAKRQGRLEGGVQLQRQLSRAIVAAVPALTIQKVRTATEVLGRYKSRHEIPARIADYFLTDLLKRGDCICGRCLDDGTSARAELETLLKSLLPNSLQDIATQLSGRLRPLSDESDQRVALVVNLLREIAASGAEIDRIDHELERIGADIDRTALDRAQLLNRERTGLAKNVKELTEAKARALRELDVASAYKVKLEDKLKVELAKREGHNEMHRGWIVAKECHDALLRAKAILEERLRATLGVEATQILQNLVSDAKKYFFSEVRVDSGFLLRVLDNEGRDVRPQLSMGETQVSSLAFMLAMTRLGGQEAPLVVDTPLARLDVSVRVNAARWLPRLTRQLILLVTDAEYGREVERELAPRVGATIRLLPGEAGTSIGEGSVG
jgi:DNA sulfur modification protein DndD